jgi:uncharacterized RDD family membrane protein YckC
MQVGVVTPEAVLLELDTASVASRSVSALIDVAVMAGTLLAVSLLVALVDGTTAVPGWMSISVLLFTVFLVLFGYPAAAETFWRGRTVGKMALGLRVVTSEGAPIRFRHAAIRSMLGIVDFWLPPGGAVALLAVLGTARDQRLGDLVAGTIVLRERQAGARATALWFLVPAGLESYAASIDTTPMTPAQYQLVRSFLLRTGELTTAARWAHGVELSRLLGRHLGHLPPPGLPPEAFLTCAAAMYQRRTVRRPPGA